jgi:hypothetical protein
MARVSSSPARESPLIAGSNERIALLRKRRQELEDEMRKRQQELEDEIMLEQQNLSNELKSQGVDTKGMTHEEMQVAKEELADDAAEVVTQDEVPPVVVSSAAPSLVAIEATDIVEDIESDGEEGEILEPTQESMERASNESVPSPEINTFHGVRSDMVNPVSLDISGDVVTHPSLDVDSDLEQGELLDTDDDLNPDAIDQEMNMVSSSPSESDESEDYEPEDPNLDQTATINLSANADDTSSSESSSDSESEDPLNPELEGEDEVTDSDSDEDSGSSEEELEADEPPVTSSALVEASIIPEENDASEDLEMADLYEPDPAAIANTRETPLVESMDTNSSTESNSKMENPPTSSSYLPPEKKSSEAAAAVLFELTPGDPASTGNSPPDRIEFMEVQDDEPLGHAEIIPEAVEQEEFIHADDEEDELYEPEVAMSFEGNGSSELYDSVQVEDGVPLPKNDQGRSLSTARSKVLTNLLQVLCKRNPMNPSRMSNAPMNSTLQKTSRTSQYSMSHPLTSS